MRLTRSLVLSVSVHAALGGLMFWLMLRPAPEDKPFIIEMPPHGFVGSPVPDGRLVQASAPTSVVFVPREPIASRPTEALTSNAPTPAPLPPAPRRVPPVNAPRPVPRPEQSTRSTVTTIEQHRQSHPVPAPAPPAPPTTSRQPLPNPRINLDEVLSSPNNEGSMPGTIPRSPGGADSRLQAAYFENLLNLLRAAHEKPHGLSDALQAQVEFTLREDGSLTAVRIVESSGIAEFDASVLAAFAKLRGLGAAPVGAAGVNKVMFRVLGQ